MMKSAVVAASLLSSAAGVLNMPKAFEAVPLTSSASIAYCSGPNAHAKNFVATLSTSSPVPGEPMTTTFTYDLDKQVTAGKAIYSGSVNGFPFSQTDDLCATQATDKCPLAVGHHVDTSTANFPDVSGKMTSTIKWNDQDGEEILCVTFTFKV